MIRETNGWWSIVPGESSGALGAAWRFASRLLPILVLVCITTRALAEPTAYLMGYHTASPEGEGDSWSLHLAVSEDGLDWMPLNQNEPVLVSPLGQKGIRDPFFLKKQDGGFVVLATDSAGGAQAATTNIFACDTADFITFRNPRLLKLHDTTMPTLAPEAFYDAGRKQYAILWSGGTDYHSIHVNYTEDFLSVGPSEVFFDAGHDVRDATLINPSEHFLYYRDAVENRVRGSRSSSLSAGGFDTNSYVKPPGDAATEAPLLVKSAQPNRWFLYGDSSTRSDGGFSAWLTDDISKDAWQEISERDYNPPLNVKHATVLPITRAEMDRLIEHWTRPKWNRLKSWNFPDCYVRHETLCGRISYYPMDPYQDSQWLLVPGLADSSGVSFEAVNYPGHYLRAVAEHVMLVKDDGSPAFKNKATFLKVPGLVNPSWSSFRSLTEPDLYLRHANYFLRLESLSSRSDKEDATFRVVY